MNTHKIPSILLVDDSPADAYLAGHYIEEAELCDNIFVRNDGQEALDFLLDCKNKAEKSHDSECKFPTMVLLDINMPCLDGFGFLQKAMESGLNTIDGQPITIVMLTTSDFPGDISRAKKFQQVGGYITKPLLETHGPMLLKLYDQNSCSSRTSLS